MEPAGGSAQKRKEEGDENLIRITAAGKERHYISYAIGLLLEKGARPVQWMGKEGTKGEHRRKRGRNRREGGGEKVIEA